MPAPTDNSFYIHTTHSPHTEPDPRIDSPPPDYTHIPTTTDTQGRYAAISQDGQYTPTLSPPHSPHTQPDPRVLNPPIFPLQVPTILGLLDFPLDTLPPNNPHTAPVHFISSNSNPQSGEAQLDFIPSSKPYPQFGEAPIDFIPLSKPNPQCGEAQVDFTPLPISNPSTPFETSLVIHDADDDAKYQEQDLDRRNSCLTLTSTIPDANNDTRYEMEISTDHSHLSPSSSTSTLVLSVPSHPGTLSPQDDEKKANIKKTSFSKESFIDTNLGEYEMNLSTADKGSFIRRLRGERAKILWIAWFVALAIVFGVLGATVWKPNHDTSPPTNNTTNNINNNSNITTSNTSNNATAAR